jgi:hypothetical protein
MVVPQQRAWQLQLLLLALLLVEESQTREQGCLE